MATLQQILFILAAGIAIGWFIKNIGQIRRNILLGKPEDFSDRKPERLKNLLLLAFGQKKMFRNPLVAVMHLVIYAGFIIINLEVLEIILDGIFGTHRLFAGFLGGLYTVLIDAFEFLAAGVFLACLIFLCRRNILKLRRFISHDLDGWPRSDANYILLTEIVLMTLFLTMNAADTILQSRGYGHYAAHTTGDFALSHLLHPLLNGWSSPSLVLLERTCWWLHILGILGFLNYLPYSKHLHILLAFPNAWYARLQPEGKLRNMPEIQKEVLYAMQPETAPAAAAEAHRRPRRDPEVRGQRCLRSELEKFAGRLFLHGMWTMQRSLPRQPDREIVVAPQDHDVHPRQTGGSGQEYQRQRLLPAGRPVPAGSYRRGRTKGLYDL